MNDRPDDPDIPLAPFPTEIRPSPFPPLGDEAAPGIAVPGIAVPGIAVPGIVAHHSERPTSPAAPETPPENPLLALGRFAFPPGEPPDDEGLAARDRRWTSRVIVITTVFLLIFNIASVQNWTRQQAPGWVTTTVSRLSEVWGEQMERLGADRPREAIRDAYEGLRDADWPG